MWWLAGIMLFLSSPGLLELWPARHRDLQWVSSGEILQGFLSTQGLGGTREGVQEGEQQDPVRLHQPQSGREELSRE